MEKSKKIKRGENWSPEEKDILRQLISNSADILEDRSTKANIITNKLNEIIGKNRSDVEIKLAWKRMKLAAKANLSLHRSEQLKTGGGEKPPSPSQEDLEVMAIAPLDFVEDRNDYDSDAVNNPSMSKVAGPSCSLDDQDPVIVFITEEEQETSVQNNNDPTVDQTRRRVTHNKNELNTTAEGQQQIVKSNLEFKQKQIEMLEVEHVLNVEIAHLRIKKLKLEIALLEKQQ